MNRHPFPFAVHQMLTRPKLTEGMKLEVVHAYTDLHNHVGSLEAELYRLRADVQRLNAENNFMLRLIEKHIQP